MANEYDITKAFARIEQELMESMIRNMERHKAEESDAGIEWSMWQAEQLKALEKYKKENRKKYGKEFETINLQIEELIRTSKQSGGMEQELKILRAIKNGFKAKKVPDELTAEFFKLNERKLEALIKATTDDMQSAETAVLRIADDQYRQAIFNAQVYANTGAGTYEKAVDMATKDMLSKGLNCVEYANGARHTLKDYADMAIRTSSKRAYLQGEGEKRKEWGISTVIMNKRGNPCPKCLPFVGKILIDDVWSGGGSKDGKYPLMSTAIAAGLYHPRCKDSHTTYFEGISTTPKDSWTKEELEEVEKRAKKEARQQYASRQVEKFERLADYSLDEENKKEYSQKAKGWRRKLKAIKDIFTGNTEHKVVEFENGLERVKNTDVQTLLWQARERVEFTVSGNKKSFYNSKNKMVYLADSAESDTIAHELFHEIDDVYGITENGILKASIQNDLRRLQNRAFGYGSNIKDMLYLEYKDAFVEGTRGIKISKKYRGISDILNGMSNGEISLGYVHPKKYWEIEGKLEAETWAQFGRILYEQDEDVMNMLQSVFPDTYKNIMEILKGMIK